MHQWFSPRRRRGRVSGGDTAQIEALLRALEQAVERMEKDLADLRAQMAARADEPGPGGGGGQEPGPPRPRFRFIRGRRLATPLAILALTEVTRRLRLCHAAWGGAAAGTATVAVTGTAMLAFHYPHPPAVGRPRPTAVTRHHRPSGHATPQWRPRHPGGRPAERGNSPRRATPPHHHPNRPSSRPTSPAPSPSPAVPMPSPSPAPGRTPLPTPSPSPSPAGRCAKILHSRLCRVGKRARSGAFPLAGGVEADNGSQWVGTVGTGYQFIHGHLGLTDHPHPGLQPFDPFL